MIQFRSDKALWAKSFGATVSQDLSKRTTHVIATPLRKTSKVRKALRYPGRVRVVTEQWLLDCISQWKHLDERPYLIDFGLDQHDVRNGTETPFSHEDALLSSEDEDSGQATDIDDEGDGAVNGTNDEDAGLTIETAAADEEEDMSKYAPHEDEKSPISPFKEDWGEMEDELREFMGSDYEDSDDAENGEEGDEESAQDNESVKNGANGQSPPLAERPSKRKRPDSGRSTDGEDSDASISSLNRGSNLQRRKRKAFERTSSLTNVRGAGDEQPAGTDDGDDGDAVALALEAEMEAELAKELEDE